MRRYSDSSALGRRYGRWVGTAVRTMGYTCCHASWERHVVVAVVALCTYADDIKVHLLRSFHPTNPLPLSPRVRFLQVLAGILPETKPAEKVQPREFRYLPCEQQRRGL